MCSIDWKIQDKAEWDKEDTASLNTGKDEERKWNQR